MLILIENGEIFAPSPLGRQSILVMGEHVARVGAVWREEAEALGVELEVVDAAGSIVIPGLIDPHQHLVGESELQAFGGRSSEASAARIAAAGITTVVGCLGVDTGTTTMQALLAKAKGLRDAGLDAHVWTGGSRVRPTMLESACADLVSFAEVIGAGEIADFRGGVGDARSLASLAADAYLGGTLSGKAGVTHIHLERAGTALPELRRTIDEQRVPADRVFLTVRNRSTALLDEIVRCAEWGAYIGIGAAGDLSEEWISQFLAGGGDPRRLTLFSDAPRADPGTLLERVFSLAAGEHRALGDVLPWATRNVAEMLRLNGTGSIQQGARANLAVVRERPLRVVEVISGGRRVVRDGEAVAAGGSP